MGKSTAHQLLLERHIPVIDTDLLAREIVEPGQPALAEIKQLFGPSVIGSDGRLAREILANRVFADQDARTKLEAILHPRIRELWHKQIEIWHSEEKPIAVVVIPLLFETKAESEFDSTICVACSAATQRQRLIARGWSGEQIQQRIQAQLPIETKLLKSDFVIWTEAGLDVHGAQLDRILAQIRAGVRS